MKQPHTSKPQSIPEIQTLNTGRDIEPRTGAQDLRHAHSAPLKSIFTAGSLQGEINLSIARGKESSSTGFELEDRPNGLLKTRNVSQCHGLRLISTPLNDCIKQIHMLIDVTRHGGNLIQDQTPDARGKVVKAD